MKLEYDPQADAASVLMGGIIVPGGDHYKEPLDADRFVRYDSDDEILEYEFLNVRRYGVKLGRSGAPSGAFPPVPRGRNFRRARPGHALGVRTRLDRSALVIEQQASGGRSKAPRQVVGEVGRALDPDREPHQPVADADSVALLGGQPAV